MSDRELLEAAAKAAGLALEWPQHVGGADYLSPRETADWQLWNPLKNDGDALRLAVKLGLAILHDDGSAVRVGWFANQQCPITMDGAGPWFWKEWLRDNGDDPNAATRRAIVRAAAAIRAD